MRRENQVSRPAGRLLAAVLFAVLSITYVHGAASPGVPAGAIAHAHASIGAALFPPASATGGGVDSETASGRATNRQWTFEEPRPPSEAQAQSILPLPAYAVQSTEADHPGAAGTRILTSQRYVGQPQGRAPPAA